MSRVRAVRLSYALANSPMFNDTNFDLGPSWTGITGANGSGKTTLLRLIAGELSPTSGRIERLPANASIHLCEQPVDAPSPTVADLARRADGLAHRLRGLLKLRGGEPGRWESLSPGERKRWQVAAALAEEPQILLLDEPTNHLDAAGRDWLLSALKQFRGTGLVVSHDRVFLDTLTSATLRIHSGRAIQYPAPYSRARDLWEAERSHEVAAWQAARDRADRLDAEVARARDAHAGASRSRSARYRMRGIHDADGRSMGADFRAERAQKHLAANLRAARHEADRVRSSLEPYHPDPTLGSSVFARYQLAPDPMLASLQILKLAVSDRTLLRDVRVCLRRDDRVWLSGANGTGKSTLLRVLLQAAELSEERVLYLPQEVSPAQEAHLWESLGELDPQTRGRVLSVVAALGLDPALLLRTPEPSPGEVRKLALALGLARHAWLLALDEPTNHLDLPSIERLEAALRAFPGAMVLVTHDVQLAQACSNRRWHLEGETILAT